MVTYSIYNQVDFLLIINTMKMRNLILLFLLILFHPVTGKTIVNNDIKGFEKKFNKIMVDLDSVISNSKNQDKLVVDHYNFIKNKIYKKELLIQFDSTLDNDFFGCAGFKIALDDPKDYCLYYGQYIVDKYPKYPALVFAILINTFQSAYDFFNNQSLFLISTQNPIEKTYFKIDALTVEGLFLKTYVKDSPNTLGYFEKLLIVDLSNGLTNASSLFEETDLGLLHKIDMIKSETSNAKKSLRKFNDIGIELLKSVDFKSDSKWKNYCSVITLKTYVFYSRQVVFDIVHLKDGVNESSFKFEDYTENYATIKKVQDVIKDNSGFLNYYSETLKLYGDFYNK